MSRWSLQFDPPDLAGWLWLAVGALACFELFRYLLRGQRPARIAWRFGICTALVLLVSAAQATGELRHFRSYHPAATGLLGLLMVPAFLRAYRETTRSLSTTARRALLALRLLALGVVMLLLTRPVIEYISLSRERSSLAILLDNSRSMGVRDVSRDSENLDPATAASRLEALASALGDHRDALSGLAEEVDLRYFSFDTQIRELDQPAVAGDGEHTALAGAIERVRTTLAPGGGKPAGIIVISDGRDNLSTDEEQRTAGEALAAAGVPLYTVGIGSELPAGQNRSLIARRLDCAESVAVLNRLPVRTEFVASGLVGAAITAELLWDDQIVDTHQLKPVAAQELLRINFEHIPTIGGLHRVTVRARAAELSGSAAETTLAQFVRVTDEKIQVLYIDRPRYERAVVVRALEAAPELRVTKVDLGRPAGDAASLVLPRTAAEWQAYHVVIIGDVDRTTLAGSTLEAIRDLVRDHGRGIALLGGLRTLGAGRYADTPLAAVSPVNLGATGQLDAPVKFELTVQGKQHAICRLAADAAAGAQIWSRLPPFDGAARLAGLTPTAEVLMRTLAGEPLVVVCEAGQGRSAVAAFDSTWRWSFAQEKGLEAQRRFWRQLAIWLANRKPEVWVSSDKPRYDLARLRSEVDRVVLRGGVSDPTTGRMPESATLAGRLTGPDGKPAEIRWIKTGETLEARPIIREAGEYHVKVSAQAGGKSLGDAEAAFVVSAPDPELADSTADIANLKRLADKTRAAGGEYVALSDFGKLVERVSAQRHATEITRVRRENVVDERPWMWFGVFVGLLTVEWVIRRRMGLV